jgi:membrane protein YqaA with SNARE-associated domain
MRPVPDLDSLGQLGLFVAAFLAGSVLPFPSEGVLAALVHQGAATAPAVLVATLGNVLGAISLYWMGRGVARGVLSAKDPEQAERARERWQRWGTWGLIFAWVPFVGDVFVLGAGLAQSRFSTFVALVTVGKAARYWLVAHAVAAAAVSSS